jgi:hypothetical protein
MARTTAVRNITAMLMTIFVGLVAQAQPEDASESRRVSVYPGTIQVREGDAALDLAFGILQEADERRWSLLPIRIAVSSEAGRVEIALNGLSLLTRVGVRYGGERVVSGSQTGDVLHVGGPITVSGEVLGSVWALGGDVSLAATARVTGDVVAIGGEIVAEPGAAIGGNQQSLPRLVVPFLGTLGSPQAALTFRFIIEGLSALLFLLVLFVVVHFGSPPLPGIASAASEHWKEAILYVLLGLIVVPLAVALLAASIVGLIIVPLLLVAVVAIGYVGLLAVTLRVGRLFRPGVETGAGNLYARAALGFALLKVPMLVGLLFQLLTAQVFNDIGTVLSTVSALLVAGATVYGFGSALAYRRTRA